jgi:hypothetical protein
MSLENFKSYLPIDDEKYSALISNDGLDGYKLVGGFHGNVILSKSGVSIKHLEEDLKPGIIKELNALLNSGGKRKSRHNKKNKKNKKNRKTKKNRRKSFRRR